MRYFAWSVAFRFLQFAHCRRCGNLDLQRISRDHVHGWFAWLFRIAQVPAYRCAPCRRRFFTVLTHRRIRPVESDAEAVRTVRQGIAEKSPVASI
jgi:hypothetical protein